MPAPTLRVNSVAAADETIVPSTLMEHNDPPSLVVMVTEVGTGMQSGLFSGVCLNDGVYYEHNWAFEEFHVFKGELTLSQM